MKVWYLSVIPIFFSLGVQYTGRTLFFGHGISPEATGNTHERLLDISEARSLSVPVPTVDSEDPVNHVPLSAESSMPVLTLKCYVS